VAIHIFHSPAGRRLRFVGNTMTNCHWGVIVTSDAADVQIEHNTFAGNDIGVEVAGASNVTIRDNLIERSRPVGDPGIAIWIDDPADAPGLLEDYNLWDPGQPPAIKSNGRSYGLSGWRAASGMSSHSIEADPKLGPDLRPTPGSPAIGAASDGTTIGAG
jgi:parallel beta-helix repeat protein